MTVARPPSSSYGGDLAEIQAADPVTGSSSDGHLAPLGYQGRRQISQIGVAAFTFAQLRRAAPIGGCALRCRRELIA
jgi:hypothetical protein